MSKTVKNFLNSREHMKNQMLDYLCIALGLMFWLYERSMEPTRPRPASWRTRA